MKREILPQFESSERGLLVRAPAKINLSLLIADKRPEGYHNLETLMAKIAFYDEIFLEKNDVAELKLICRGLWSPEGKENLVYKAAELFYKTIGKQPDVKITLTKNIPAGSGLGGASSDAASVILALNKLHNQVLPESKLYELCAQLGSDVSFFLGGPLSLCTGRGEKVEKIDKKLDFLLLLILPNINVSTKRVYEAYKVDMNRFNELSSKIRGYIADKKIALIPKLCANMLAKTCFVVDNGLALLQVKIQEMTKMPVCLSGSGSAFFVFSDDASCHDLDILRSELNSQNCNCIIVSSNEW
jgi:4-diphosphocytidyl-2-C-methyl-D-erythritol kinase